MGAKTFYEDAGTSSAIVVAAHPVARLTHDSARHVARVANARAMIVDVSERTSFDAMIDDLEDARRSFGVERWIFWGMSGGGWLALLYAHRHPESLAGIVVESACLCFRERLRDAACGVSPFYPAWREPLARQGMLDEHSHDEAALGDTEWSEVDGVGHVFRRRSGAALLVSPAPVDDGMRRQMPLLWTFDARPWIADVRVPALVVAGSLDPVVPLAHVRDVHDAIATSTFIVVDGGGHVPSATQPVDAIRTFVAVQQ